MGQALLHRDKAGSREGTTGSAGRVGGNWKVRGKVGRTRKQQVAGRQLPFVHHFMVGRYEVAEVVGFDGGMGKGGFGRRGVVDGVVQGA